MGAEVSDVAVWGYGAAFAAYLLFGLYLLVAARRGLPGSSLLVAIGASAAWALASAFLVLRAGVGLKQLVEVFDVLRGAAWFAFLLILLYPAGGGRLRWPTVVAVLIVGMQLILAIVARFGFSDPGPSATLSLGSFLIGAVFGLVLVEQLFRALPVDSRWGLKPLCLGLAAGYVFELYLFADGVLFGRLDADIWSVRGIAHALVIPLISLSASRNPAWTFRIAMSREVVFHSTALAVSGLYLLLISGAGYYVRYFGGDWGRAMQLALLFAGLLLLVVLLFSGSQRARLRVFINKHLFPYRYDYRKEWLRFTQALSSAGGVMDLGQSVIKALADLVESSGGVLWLADASGRFSMNARLNQSATDGAELDGSPFCRFLGEREWIVNLEEFRSRPAHYAGLVLPRWLSAMPDAWLVIPLKSSDTLIGFVVLNAPRTAFEVNWEVLDLLKTAQRQAASYLERMLAAEALLESRKFDSFNRMSAFVVHDLKNLVAQLSLMLKNAERHKHNPSFQEDMLETVAHVESRMRNLMTQLQEKRSIDPRKRVDLVAVVERVRASKRHQRPPLRLVVEPGEGLEVDAHVQRLERVIGHLVQNALDATPEDGNVSLRLGRRMPGSLELVVEDTGCGMTEEFMREHLFKPFSTSKSTGMGIGVYEAQQYIQELGGRIQIESQSGCGTRATIVLPIADRADEGMSAMPEYITEHHE
ncbi:MAG: PEP-CTERM system histidine kinase PrsK [Aromatoleum sp.]|jgi:putative PEP-CTERM system histidine kinase|uniref:XrtA/PEP-CTERM system histidine kinase PrsK n=1 Tax=Aromatoleum sp. TaxID=2307007 RepID=UPI0028955281|nr:XrtA/PEP-CTERM system histidine kinase PrsK [Aromatoleum sp.]MDT3672819.1 PEP-CTERM system histidine kinase PrsK [Aromatoleum sp.]